MFTLRAIFCICIIGVAAFAEIDKIPVAVLSLDAIGISAKEAQILTKKLSSELVNNGKYLVLDRGEMESILQEQGFQQTGCTSSECAVEVGQLLGVKMMVAGSIGKLGSIYYTEVSLIDVATSQIVETVDHSQSGGIEEVLLNSMPVIASRLSGDKVDDVPKEVEPLLFVPEEGTEYSEWKDEYKDEPETVPETKCTFISHHHNSEIYLNNELIGRNQVEVVLPKENFSIYEKTKIYKSIPQRISLDSIPKYVIGVGGEIQENVLSFGYAITGNSSYGLGAFTFTFGTLRQSYRSGGLNLILGSIDGFTTFDDEPDSSMLDEVGVVTLGGLFEWRREWEVAEVFKWGIGFDLGYLYNRTQTLENTKNEQFIDAVRTDLTAENYGGLQLKFAIGKKKVFLESKLHFLMGSETEEVVPIAFDSFGDFEWDASSEDTYFLFKPMYSFNVLFTL